MRDWNRKRWNWKRAVKKDPRLSDAAKLLAVSLCDDFAHHETARCTPHVGTLAECLGKSDRSIQRALAELRKHRWIDVKHRRGRGVRSEIFFENGDGTVPISSPEKVTELASYKTEKATVMSKKHDNRVTPYIEPNNNQNTRECAGEGRAVQDRPH